MESVPRIAGSISDLERIEPDDASLGSGCRAGGRKGYCHKEWDSVEDLGIGR